MQSSTNPVLMRYRHEYPISMPVQIAGNTRSIPPGKDSSVRSHRHVHVEQYHNYDGLVGEGDDQDERSGEKAIGIQAMWFPIDRHSIKVQERVSNIE